VLNLWVLLPVSYTQEWKEQTKPVFLSQEWTVKKDKGIFKNLFSVHFMTCRQMHISGICSLLTIPEQKKNV
jgi:hypothetical protein